MPKAKNITKKYISYLARYTIAVLGLYLAFKNQNLREYGENLIEHKWIFAAALGIYILSQLIFVARWSLLMRVQDIKIGYWPAVRLHFLGLFYNNCLPSSVGGDFLRAWYVTKHTDKKLQAALSVFVDRAVGLTGIFIMAIFCYMFLPAQKKDGQNSSQYDQINFLPGFSEQKWLLIGIPAAFLLILAAFLVTRKGKAILQQSLLFIRSRTGKYKSKFFEAITIYRNKKSALFFALLLTFACQGLFVVGLWLIGREVITAHLKYYLIFFPVSWLLGTLPISVGGAGIMELWLNEMFKQVSGLNELVGFPSACQRIIWLLGSLPGVVIHIIGAHLPKDFSIDYNESVS